MAAAAAHRAVTRFTTPGIAFGSITTTGRRTASAARVAGALANPPMLTTTSLPRTRRRTRHAATTIIASARIVRTDSRVCAEITRTPVNG